QRKPDLYRMSWSTGLIELFNARQLHEPTTLAKLASTRGASARGCAASLHREAPMNEPFRAPVVDSLSVRVVVDSVFDQFMPKATHPMCTIEHVGRIRHNLNSTLAGEWGLSLHLESRTDGTTGQYLLDFGYTPEILIRNFTLLGIEPERLNGLILSHGHRDHYGGLAGFIAHYCDRIPVDLRLFSGGQGTLPAKWVGSPGGGAAFWGTRGRGSRSVAG